MKSFIKAYFDDKPLEELKKTITPGWTEKNLLFHLGIIDIPEDAINILEIGCGIGRLLPEIAAQNRKRKVIGMDASVDMIKEGRIFCKHSPNVSLYHIDGFDMESFAPLDFIFAWLVFQHIPDTNTVLDFVRHAGYSLAPGGQCKFQLLRHDEKPKADLWSWHDPIMLVSILNSIGCSSSITHLNDRWTMVEGTKIL